MADLLLSPLIKIVMQKAADSLGQQIAVLWGVNDQRERLKDMLLAIEDILTDAENQAATKQAVRNRMLKLKSAAYDADDVLDEFCYEELRRDAVKRGHKVGNNVSDFLSLNNPALFRYRMSRKLKKVVGGIEQIVADMGKFGFVQGQRVQVMNRVRTDSLLVESNVVGRDEDKEKLVKLLIEGCGRADLMVVPVVGMGGLGKTTLAKLVYNDPRLKEHFRVPLWVCVSKEFNLSMLVKSIIDLVIHEDSKLPLDNMELLQRRLHQELSGKRYLLVLDDVWNDNENDWERLRATLNCGDSGSGVIVTTRSGRVASIMGTVENYDLGCLGEEDSWTLFHKKAFSKGVKECQELSEIGRRIVKNCRGLPLAIRTLGALMSSKHEVREWLAILKESNIWEQRQAQDEVLPVLRLSYDHLPPFMKQCFAFCAVFPKDFIMVKEELIRYWIANGFIPVDGPGSLETKGNDIFNELSWGSFFQDVEQVSWISPNHKYTTKEGHCHISTCKMHDLMHDLAQSIMGDECMSMFNVPNQYDKPKSDVRHISLETIPVDINNVMDFLPSIRSFIFCSFISYYTYMRNLGFVKSNTLRILVLGRIEPIERALVMTPEKMKHLRYLEIYGWDDELLPETISTLYLLQTLRLFRCWALENLPEGLRFMSSLRHLHIEECNRLKSMPSGIGQLSCLQTLTTYVIGPDERNSIAEIKNLNLHGKLHIYNLREVRDVADAREANLEAKKNLDDLLLCWGTQNESYDYGAESNPPLVMHCDPFEVLDALKPCNKLKVLGVILYGSDKFPDWMTEYQMLENLVELYIKACRVCTKIPPVEKLPFLKILKLEHVDKLIHLCNRASASAEGGEDSHVVFPSLEQLQLSETPNLLSWCEGEVGNETSLVFPVLRQLNITNCPKLVALPKVPLLKQLNITNCPKLVALPTVPLLKELYITNCPKLVALPEVPLLKVLFVNGNRTLSSFATKLTTLQVLSLKSNGREVECESESISFQPWESLQSLSLAGYRSIELIGANKGEEVNAIAGQCKDLTLTSCSVFLSHSPTNLSLQFWKSFAFLSSLSIDKCDSLIYWPEEEFASLNCLTRISVDDCQNFLGSKLVPSSGRSNIDVLLPKLKYLTIFRCPNLVEIPNCSADLQRLSIYRCPKLECMPEWLWSLGSLTNLTIEECKSLNPLPMSMAGLTSLEVLRISDCPILVDLPDGMEGLTALKELEIRTCPKLRVFPEGLLKQLKNLDKLRIEGCPHLERHFRKFHKYHHFISEIRVAKIGDKRKSGILKDLFMSVSSCKFTCLAQS